MIAARWRCRTILTCAQALAIAEKYHQASEQAKAFWRRNAQDADIDGPRNYRRVWSFCTAAAAACRELGYEPVPLTDQLCCGLPEAGSFLVSIVRTAGGKSYHIAGGETTPPDRQGPGGRNQEFALAAAPAPVAAGQQRSRWAVTVPTARTDAAGGYVMVTPSTDRQGLEMCLTPCNNDAYHAPGKLWTAQSRRLAPLNECHRCLLRWWGEAKWVILV